MNRLYKMDSSAISELYSSCIAKHKDYCALQLSLDLSRGKPNSSQLDLSQGLLSVEMTRDACFANNGMDCRNYGLVDGLPEVKALFASLLSLREEDIIVGGNSSLQLMHDTLVRAMLFGFYNSERPWSREEKLKWICITPGYDRHFKITEALGFELISVPMLSDGPDMDAVEELVLDPSVKGIWCVPKYSNPTGNTYSDETVERLASMRCGAADFKIMWDNAYAVHDFDENGDKLADIFDAARRYGNEDRIIYFSSTSKITFPGGGVAIMAASEKNRKQMLPLIGIQTIGFDKLNQLRHVKYFGNAENMKEHMLKLGKVIGKKFEIVNEGLKELKELGIAEWTVPNGGYFISLDLVRGTAKRVFALMKEAGVTLTAVGATYPYGIDPEDKNLRIAPSYPSDDELRAAIEILVNSAKIATIEKL